MDNKKVINALSFDVEEWFHCTHLEGYIHRSEWETHQSRIENNIQSILALLKKKETRGTFFVLGWVAQRHPQVVKEIADQGHEIATHGWSHLRATQQSPEQFKAELKKSKDLLQKISGQTISGHRAACFGLTSRTQWIIDILLKMGFTYDSSIFPIIHDKYGMVKTPRFPYLLREQKGERLLEFPLSTLKFMGINIPFAGGGYFRLYPYFLTRYFISRLNQAGQPAMIYLHPPELDPGQPRLKIDPINNFRIYVGIKNNLRKLEKLLEDFRFAPAREVLKQAGWFRTVHK
jgi:polysaccharide deacetylase family protein (PEP-CTERM system associated)